MVELEARKEWEGEKEGDGELDAFAIDCIGSEVL